MSMPSMRSRETIGRLLRGRRRGDGRHLAHRVDGKVGGRALFVLLQVQHVQIVGRAEFFEQNAGRAGARIRSVVQGQVYGDLVMTMN